MQTMEKPRGRPEPIRRNEVPKSESADASKLGDRVLVLAPFGRDAAEICRILDLHGIATCECEDLQHMCREIRRDAGVALLAEDVLEDDATIELSTVLLEQPTWSDFPFLVLTSASGADGARWMRANRIVGATYLNLLERPIRVSTLVSAVNTALQARRRQYEVRDELAARTEAETALRKSESRIRTLANAMPQLVWSAGADGNIDYFNDRASFYAGIGSRDSGRTGTPVIHPDDRARTSEAWRKALARGEAYEVEHRVQLLDGSYRWHLSRSEPARGDDGSITRWFGTTTDIHDQVELREALLRSRSELQRLNQDLERRVAERTAELADRNEELQQFAYVASHDFQEPLRKIQTFANLIEIDSHDLLDTPARFYLGRIKDAARRMSELLKDMLDFSRVSTHAGSMHRVSVSEIVQQVLLDLELNMREVNAVVEVDADVQVVGDANQLRQVINHLMLNALKFRRPGVDPRVRISAAETQHPGDQAGGPLCSVIVEDNGIGIDPRYADRIFQPFERLHGKGEFPGTGMGLAICRRIVQRHGGSIRAEGRVDVGSRFVIQLPMFRTASNQSPGVAASGK